MKEAPITPALGSLIETEGSILDFSKAAVTHLVNLCAQRGVLVFPNQPMTTRGNGSARTRIPGGPPRRGRACRIRTSARARDRPRARPPRLLRLPDSARPKMRTCATARRPTRRRPSAPLPPRSSPSRGTRTSTRSLTSGASRTRTCSACTRDAAANGSAVGATDFTTRRRRRQMRREARLVKKEPKPSFSSRTGARTPR